MPYYANYMVWLIKYSLKVCIKDIEAEIQALMNNLQNNCIIRTLGS